MPDQQVTHRAITLRKIEGTPGKLWYPLQILPIPTPSQRPSQLLLRPTHLSLNHRDLFLRQHLYPSPSFTTPLFSDACCLVISSSKPRRVLLNPGHGWLSDPAGPENAYGILGGTRTIELGVGQEVIAVKEDEVVECPEHLSGAEGAALPLVGLTAWRALVEKSGAAIAGNNILVTGIGGGVALMTLLFAVKMGIRVWVTSSSTNKIARAKELGAQGGINYREKGWEKKLLAMLPKERPSLDAIIDGAGGDIATKGVRLLKHGGTVVSYGMTLAPTLPFPMSAVLRNLNIHGSTMGSRREFHDMIAFVDKEKIRPVVSRVVSGKWENEGEILEGLEELFEDMRGGVQMGKLVFELEADGRGRDGGSKL